MKIARVRITMDVPVEITDYPGHDPVFRIEENGCPGTGSVGLAIEQIQEYFDSQQTCGACAMRGRNEILAVYEFTPEEVAAQDEWERQFEGEPSEHVRNLNLMWKRVDAERAPNPEQPDTVEEK